jgi:3-methyladenine DNA glycosylase AlkD
VVVDLQVVDPNEDLVAAVRDGLETLADPDRAPGMQSYMRSAMPYRGVPMPAVRRLVTRVGAAHPLTDRAVWVATVRALWHGAGYREERYAAIDLTGLPRYAGWQDAATLDLYRELVLDGAWWDFVDEMASRRVGPILRANFAAVAPIVRGWSTDPDKWVRRTAILAQLQSKLATDTALLTDVFAPNLLGASDGDPVTNDFFIRKALGWALREYAKTDPVWVRAYVVSHADVLSNLTRREALRRIGGEFPVAEPALEGSIGDR